MNKLGSVTTSAEIRELTRAAVFHKGEGDGAMEGTTTNSDIDRNLNALQKEIRTLRETMN